MILILPSSTLSKLFAYSSTSDPGLSTSLRSCISSLTLLTTSSIWVLCEWISYSSSSKIFSINCSWSVQSSSTLSPYCWSSSSKLIVPDPSSGSGMLFEAYRRAEISFCDLVVDAYVKVEASRLGLHSISLIWGLVAVAGLWSTLGLWLFLVVDGCFFIGPVLFVKRVCVGPPALGLFIGTRLG